MENKLIGIIPTGNGNARKGHELANILGWELRDITKAIQQLRREGHLICASSNGYFLPELGDIDEIKKYHRHLSGRVVETRRSLQTFTDFLIANGEEVG